MKVLDFILSLLHVSKYVEALLARLVALRLDGDEILRHVEHFCAETFYTVQMFKSLLFKNWILVSQQSGIDLLLVGECVHLFVMSVMVCLLLLKLLLTTCLHLCELHLSLNLQLNYLTLCHCLLNIEQFLICYFSLINFFFLMVL